MKTITEDNQVSYSELYDMAWSLHKFGGDKKFKKDISELIGYADTSAAIRTLVNLKQFCEEEITNLMESPINY